MHGADPLAPGRMLAERYRIGPLLGTGGMSFVHRGTDVVLGRDVAIKALVHGSADPTERQRVQAEIDVLAGLSHRALVTLFDAGSAAADGVSFTYLAMELVDGPTLGTRAALGAIAPNDIATMARDLAEALVVVHAAGVVHRDIKPANVLLAPTPVPGREFDAKLADFGIATLVDGTRLTATGTVLGTAAYLSPEQATGARVGPASDVYSLGLVLLESITGRREYPGPLMESLTARQSRDPVVPGAIGYRWKSLLAAMTARDPEARPSAPELLELLADAGGAAALPLADGRDAGATAPLVGDAGATAPLVRDATTTADLVLDEPAVGRRRARRGWVLVGSIAAGLALLVTTAVLGLQQLAAPVTSDPPSVAETPVVSDPPVQTTEPDEEPAESATTPPAQPAPLPAVIEEGGQEPAAPSQGNGNGSSGNGNGNGNGNSGNGNGNGSGNGNSGNGNGSSGNGNGNGNGNG
ncbi:serine/threonine-protein kinase [Agrococcus sp. Marseille-P2731]|uniref:serine/threonine-protein kinase n=1 Tax=Agrococcus sp. Marseille-P2731 TaxID=1841862 RepID=UPI001160861F|nr:serine/threonine-protein kinase [Agrococcus sp. Marseille-P2731]